MAGTPIAGKGGSVLLPGTPATAVSEITDWTLQIDAENYESSAMGQDWRTYVPGLRGYQGRFTGFYVVDQDTQGQLAIENALLTGTSLVIQLQLSQGRGYYEGTVNITQVSVGVNFRQLATFDATYVGTGSLQHNP